MREKTQAGYVLGKTAATQDHWVPSRMGTAACFCDSNKNGGDNSDDDNGETISYNVTHQLIFPHPHELRTITSSFCLSEAESLYTAQAGMELRSLLSPPPECWDHWWAASTQVLPLSSFADDETEQESK